MCVCGCGGVCVYREMFENFKENNIKFQTSACVKIKSHIRLNKIEIKLSQEYNQQLDLFMSVAVKIALYFLQKRSLLA